MQMLRWCLNSFIVWWMGLDGLISAKWMRRELKVILCWFMNCWMVWNLSNVVDREILDFGYPQNTDIDSLKMYITTESIKTERAVVTLCESWGNVSERRFVTYHQSGNRGYVISPKRHQISSKRSVCGCYRKCKPIDVCNRSILDIRSDCQGQHCEQMSPDKSWCGHTFPERQNVDSA